MSEPNCTIVVSLFDQPANLDPPCLIPTRFSYHCISCSSGWSVLPEGSIFPPSRSRIVQIRVGYPAGASITGFQLVSDPTSFPSGTTDPWHAETGLEGIVTVNDSTPFPPQPGTSVSALTLDFRVAGQLLHYRLKVNDVWDDPKIYNDPDE